MLVPETPLPSATPFRRLGLSWAFALVLAGLPVRSQLPPLPQGWKVAEFPDPADLRHSAAYQADPAREWAVTLADGKLAIKDWSYHLRPLGPSFEQAGVSRAAQVTALKLGRHLVDIPPDQHVQQLVQVTDGWLVGFNAGEWGGGLCWVSTDGRRGRFLITQAHLPPPPPPPPPRGTAKGRVIPHRPSPTPPFPGWIPWFGRRMADHIPENVLAILEHKGSYLVFEGLSHIALDRGKVLKVTRDAKGEWSATELQRFDSVPVLVVPDGPEAWLILTHKSLLRMDAKGTVSREVPLPDAIQGGSRHAVVPEGEGQWLVLTDANLYRLAANGQSRLLLSAAFLGNPAMNSLVRMDDGTVFIGMRHYLLRLVPRGEGYAVARLEPESAPERK